MGESVTVRLTPQLVSIFNGEQLVAPFTEPRIQMVKATYRRTIDGAPSGGGRVTELTAKPLLHMFFPELSVISQPLGAPSIVRR